MRRGATGPYVNVCLNAAQAATLVALPWARGDRPESERIDEKVMVAFSQTNSHKAFHVGHLRKVYSGDSLVRSLRARGHEVVAANSLGNVGTHTAKCPWGYGQLDEAQCAQIPAQGRGEWLGDLYARQPFTGGVDAWDRAC